MGRGFGSSVGVPKGLHVYDCEDDVGAVSFEPAFGGVRVTCVILGSGMYGISHGAL